MFVLLSWIGLGLVILLFGLFTIGILKELSKKQIRLLAFVAVSICVVITVLSGVFYVWHHSIRPLESNLEQTTQPAPIKP